MSSKKTVHVSTGVLQTWFERYDGRTLTYSFLVADAAVNMRHEGEATLETDKVSAESAMADLIGNLFVAGTALAEEDWDPGECLFPAVVADWVSHHSTELCIAERTLVDTYGVGL